ALDEDIQTEEVENQPEAEEVVEETEDKTPETDESAQKAAEYLDRLQRLMAEFDNYRKRTETEKHNLYDMAVSSTVTELLPVVDNFERALKQECQDETFGAGISMIYKQLLGILEKLQVTPIEAAGKPFDPAFHNAVLHIEDENLEDNIVAEELQKGYLFKEKVIRYSMVKVAN
ncbi:MAG: nucleotide exchange factor GrpE, partial [Cellulosilyticaceae bacterium]